MADEMKMGGLELAPNLGIATGPIPENRSQDNVDAGIKMAGMGRQGLQQSVDAQKAVSQMKLNYDPINDIFSADKIPGAVARSLIESRQQVNQYQNLYNDLIAENLQRQQREKDHPFMNTLSELAASFARNDPNPYTRAIGQAATRLNPTLDELQEKEVGLLKSAEGFAARREAIDAGLLRTAELGEQKKQAGFTRLLATFEQMARGGLDKMETYLAAAKKAGVDEATAKDLASGFIKQVIDKRQLDESKRIFAAEQKDLDRLSKEKLKAGDQAISRARVGLATARFNLQRSITSGETLNVPKLMEERRKLLGLKAQLENNAIRGFEAVQRTATDALIRYLPNRALDRDGTFKGEITSAMAPSQSAADAGLRLAQGHMEEIDVMIAELDDTLARHGAKGEGEFADVTGGSKVLSGEARPKKTKATQESEGFFSKLISGALTTTTREEGGIPTSQAFKDAFARIGEGGYVTGPNGRRIYKRNGKPSEN